MDNKKTCLYDRHVAQGALMTSFAGFEMPVQYSSIIEEHTAVRTACGVFDVSHMGEVWISGKDATRFVNYIFTNDVAKPAPGKVVYGMLCRPDGGTVDDTCICKMAEDRYLLTVNAANIAKDVAWIEEHAAGFEVCVAHESDRYGQLAIQGPKAAEVVREVLALDCDDLRFYEVKTIDCAGEQLILSRTGYTGEDGFELYGSPQYIVAQWDKLLQSGRCLPCGLGCRDTLRFEVGLPLYGDELTDEISPIMAGLSLFVCFDKGDFIGREALLRQKEEGVSRRLRGIELDGNAVPRHGYTVLAEGCEVGVVTTGYRLISVEKSCAVALVDAGLRLGDRVEVQIRKKTYPGTIVKKKFYDKHYHK